MHVKPIQFTIEGRTYPVCGTMEVERTGPTTAKVSLSNTDDEHYSYSYEVEADAAFLDQLAQFAKMLSSHAS